MSLDSFYSSRCYVWLMAGVLAMTAGCSSSPDKGAGTSGSGAASSATSPTSGENPGSNPLTFGSDNKGDIGVAPVPEPPIAPPDASRGPQAAPSPLTLPPDLPPAKPEASKSGPIVPLGSAAPPKAGEPVPVPPKAE